MKDESSAPFETVDEILTDVYFIGFVETKIDEIKERRKRRPIPRPGDKYRRDWTDRMGGKLRASYFIEQISDIWRKQSSLNKEQRNIIKYVCDIALAKAIRVYNPENVKL